MLLWCGNSSTNSGSITSANGVAHSSTNSCSNAGTNCSPNPRELLVQVLQASIGTRSGKMPDWHEDKTWWNRVHQLRGWRGGMLHKCGTARTAAVTNSMAKSYRDSATISGTDITTSASQMLGSLLQAKFEVDGYAMSCRFQVSNWWNRMLRF